jgi:GMP synthase (glutamine-hydrolysing) A subunit
VQPQIIVLDAGGQYCHLEARRVRDLGVYAEVRASETPAAEIAFARGIIISGGPASVYDPESPTVDPAIFAQDQAVLGICYGQQLMAHVLGGHVRPGEKGEYGLATLDLEEAADPLFAGLSGRQQIWMSHRDVVETVPEGFQVVGRTDTCAVAAIAAPGRRLYGLQFHPEVAHTARGMDYLANFVFRVCGCEKDWDPRNRIPLVEQEIRECARGRSVFFFVSGGVDSTVAFTLCTRALGEERVRGVYVDTGLMREGETDFVSRMPGVTVEHSESDFLTALAGVTDPEQKRHIIGEEFVRVQERIIASRRLADEHWILGQGTIYPDTIESGGTSKAAVIKTHHNRVAGIQKLIECGRIVEPLKSFYKDEVREIGRELGLPGELLDRHPFPVLGVRCAGPRYARRHGGAGELGGGAGGLANLCAGAGDRSAGPRACHGAGQSSARRQSRDCRRENARSAGVHAGVGLFDHAGAAGAPAARGRDCAPPVAHQRIRPRGVAVSRDPDSSGDGGGARFRGAAARGFGGRHDRTVSRDEARTPDGDVPRNFTNRGDRGSLLRPDAQAAWHHRVGVKTTAQSFSSATSGRFRPRDSAAS